jgi:hypothetical protein
MYGVVQNTWEGSLDRIEADLRLAGSDNLTPRSFVAEAIGGPWDGKILISPYRRVVAIRLRETIGSRYRFRATSLRGDFRWCYAGAEPLLSAGKASPG